MTHIRLQTIEELCSRIGIRVVVMGRTELAKIERVSTDPKTGVVIIYLDLGQFGKSRVFAHNEGTIWRLYSDLN